MMVIIEITQTLLKLNLLLKIPETPLKAKKHKRNNMIRIKGEEIVTNDFKIIFDSI